MKQQRQWLIVLGLLAALTVINVWVGIPRSARAEPPATDHREARLQQELVDHVKEIARELRGIRMELDEGCR